jgi:hypothetical protein
MLTQQIYTILLWVQGIYTLLTALWGLIDIRSFMRVTGPKTDIWLVKTVSVLLLPITFCFFAALFLNMPFLPVTIIGILTTSGLAAIDFYYTTNRTIKWVYALDGIAEVLFLITWIYLLLMHK